jgi:hypothetical protein
LRTPTEYHRETVEISTEDHPKSLYTKVVASRLGLLDKGLLCASLNSQRSLRCCFFQ